MSKLSDEKLEQLQKKLSKRYVNLKLIPWIFTIIKKRLKNITRRVILRIIKILIFLFLFSFTTHAFAKSNEYYQSVITNIITNCKTDQCRKDIFEQEVHIAFFNLLDAILNQVQFEISQRKKEKLWSNEL
jgi:hypothetical protein